MSKTTQATIKQQSRHLERTQALAYAEWEAARRILEIQNAALHRFVELQSEHARNPGRVLDRHPDDPAMPWRNLYGEMVIGMLETSVISIDTLAAVQAEFMRLAREALPLVKSEMLDGVEQMNQAIESVAAALPASTKEAA
ncbi:MAG: hypothetical protein KDH15_17545 [Rhodocyclaceae bacterium]|nr:hypothetical protein [Rhodocyclaceae bacterium]